MVDLAMVVAHRPTVLLLDEPSSGIAQREAEALGPALLAVRDRLGCALVVIEHDMPLIQSVSDRLLALDTGSVVLDGLPEDVVTHPQVVASYLGNNTAAVQRSGGGGSPGASVDARGAAEVPVQPTRPRRRRPPQGDS
jgi:branched-chain amino acid transport system ATP-binding protein